MFKQRFLILLLMLWFYIKIFYIHVFFNFTMSFSSIGSLTSEMLQMYTYNVVLGLFHNFRNYEKCFTCCYDDDSLLTLLAVKKN